MAKSSVENAPPEHGKTLLEILELEMRARAIRALLKQSGSEKGTEQTNDEAKSDDANKNGNKNVMSEVVDLTECEDEEFPVQVKKENPEEADIEKKVSTFEKKIEKSKTEKSSIVKEDEKTKRLQAELELRNKLFKKKIYRTRQQRMESEEEDKSNEIDGAGGEESKAIDVTAEVVVKKEPLEPDEIVVEDPEEGEISTSEDEFPVEIKQEVIEPDLPVEPEFEEPVNFEAKIDEDGERVTAIDNGTFVSNSNLENPIQAGSNNVIQLEKANEPICSNNSEMNNQENEKNTSCVLATKETEKNEPENLIEETSWRDRWLQKDGVQKLVKSSKIYAKVKKRIAEKSQKAKEDIPTVQNFNPDLNSMPKVEVIEGSIEEYERLLGRVPDQKKESELTENRNSKVSAVLGNARESVETQVPNSVTCKKPV